MITATGHNTKMKKQYLLAENLIVLKFFSPTNAPLYYTYKILKCTVKISHVCSYMFRSTWTIFRELMLSLAKVTVLWN
jgi:hypothetical protein